MSDIERGGLQLDGGRQGALVTRTSAGHLHVAATLASDAETIALLEDALAALKGAPDGQQ